MQKLPAGRGCMLFFTWQFQLSNLLSVCAGAQTLILLIKWNKIWIHNTRSKKIIDYKQNKVKMWLQKLADQPRSGHIYRTAKLQRGHGELKCVCNKRAPEPLCHITLTKHLLKVAPKVMSWHRSWARGLALWPPCCSLRWQSVNTCVSHQKLFSAQ